MPVQPEYQSRPSSRIGRQACAAIETRIASVSSSPCTALGLGANLAAIGVDATGRAAGLLFAAPKHLKDVAPLVERFGRQVADLALGVEKLYQLRVATRASPGEQSEVLRKMVLGMVEDVRVVLIRLASRTQTLRWFARNDSEEPAGYRPGALLI